MADAVIVRTPEPRDAAAGAHTCGHGSTVGGQAADAGFLVDGDEVGQSHGPKDLLLVGPHKQAVAPHGHGGGDALVAAAGADDHRHLAAVHPGVGPGGAPGPGLGLDAGAGSQQGGADVGAPVPLKPFSGNGAVALDLSADKGADTIYGYGFNKGKNVFHIENALVLQIVLGGCACGLLQQDLTVLFYVYQIGVVVGHAGHGLVCPGPACETDVQHTGGFRAGDGYLAAVQIGLDLGSVRLGDTCQHLQLGRGISRHDAHGDGGVNAPAAARIGHHHGFHVFQDIAADLGQHFFRLNAQHLTQLCSTIRNGDGLCTPGGQEKLLRQNGTVGFCFPFV